MAGSGNLDLLRKLRKLHGKVSSDIGYGSHMACHMAIGFLFLGGGTYTLGTSNKAIAALICSLYPKYPTTVIDNRSHLQAFRHLWVLAVEHRCLITRNINDKNICPVPITVTVYDDITRYDIPNVNDNTPTHDIKLVTPCILPEFDMIKSIKIDNPRYWPITLNFLENPKYMERIKETQTIIVNRKIGHLDYNKDPKGNKSILCRTFSNLLSSKYKKNSQKQNLFKDFLSAFTEDPIILAYAKIICNYYELPFDDKNNVEKIKVLNNESKKLSDFFSTILYKCISTDKLKLLSIYSSIFIIHNNFFDKGSIYDLWNLKLIIAYYYNNIDNITNTPKYPDNEFNEDNSKRHLEANILSQLYLQLDLFFMSRQINDDISNNFINKGDQEYKNIKSTLPKKDVYKYMISNVIPNFNEKLKSFLLLQTSEMENNNIELSDRDIAFIGSYLNYHDVPYTDELYSLRDLFESYQTEIDNSNASDNTALSDTSSSNEFDLMLNDSHKVEAFYYVVMSHPHLNSVTYQIIKDLL